MTDDTGLLEHSMGLIPRRQEGYTTDDNARALWACFVWLERLQDMPQTEEARKLLLRLAETYSAFLLWAQRPDGWFHNNFHYDRTPEREDVSDDCLGRAIWAAAAACVQPFHPGLKLPAANVLLGALRHIETMTSPRGWAYALSACCLLMRLERQQEIRGLPAGLIREIGIRCSAYVKELEAKLLQLYRVHAEPGWSWFEPVLAYGNGSLPWSLLEACQASGSESGLKTGLLTLDFLTERMMSPQGSIRPVGNHGWGTKDRLAMWDQQPLDVMELALAADTAYRVTKRREYRETVIRCREWFYGRNDAGTALIDSQEGACCDGLTPDGPNANCGAESMLAYLLTEAIWSDAVLEEAEDGRRAATIPAKPQILSPR